MRELKCTACGRVDVPLVSFGTLEMIVCEDATRCIDRFEGRAASLNLWIYVRAWECHRNGSIEIRDYLRAVWRAAGHATAVER